MLISVCVLLAANYSWVQIPAVGSDDTVTDSLLTNGGVVAANWYFHGGGPAASVWNDDPAVFEGGKSIPLPLGEASNGHVASATDAKIVGSVYEDSSWKPAVWTKGGSGTWKDAVLTVLDQKDAQGFVAGKDGGIWCKRDELLFEVGGAGSSCDCGNFDPVGMDSNGRWIGNKYRSIGTEGMREDEAAGYFESGDWHPLKDES